MTLNFKKMEIFLSYIVKYVFLITIKIKDQNIMKSVSNKSNILIFNNRTRSSTNAGNICKNL